MKETKFKQTEIGMIPDDWEVKELGEIAFVTKLAGFEFTAHVKYSDQGTIIALRGLNVRQGYLELEDVKYIDNSNFSKLNRSKLFKDDLLFTYVGTVGNVALVDKNDSYYLAPNVALIRNMKQICSQYIMYLLLSTSFFNSQIKTLMSTTSQAALSMTNIRLFKIPLPPTLAEQQKIAKALSDVDNVISTLEKLITKKKNLKQGTMQQLLTGKKRLPGFAKSSDFKQTEIGEIPEDWEVVNISRMCTIKARIGWQGLKSDEYLDTGDYLLITGTDFDNGFINWKNCSYVTEWRFKQDKNIQIKKGDVLITKDGTIGKVAFLNEVPMAGTLNSGVFVVRPKDYDLIDSVFLSLIFKSFWFDNFLEQITSGSTIVHLYQKDFVKFNYILPSKPEQTAIANVLSSMDKEIEGLEAKLGKYRDLKTGMMQQLLTGMIRLVMLLH